MFNFLLHISANHRFVFLAPKADIFQHLGRVSSCLWCLKVFFCAWTEPDLKHACNEKFQHIKSFNVVPANIYTDNQADSADQDLIKKTLYIWLYNLCEIQLFVPNLQKMSELRDPLEGSTPKN